MASLLLGIPNSFPTEPNEDGSPGRRKKIPKVAVYVAGAAFAVTSGLTLLVLPFVRQAAKQSNPTQFVNNRYMPRLTARQLPSATSTIPTQAAESSTTSSAASSSRSVSSTISISSYIPRSSAASSSSPSCPSSSASALLAHPDSPSDAATLRDKRFNDREERSLYGVTLAEEENTRSKTEPISPFLGFQALGIASGIVLGSAGLGAWIVAKLLGVNDMTEFSVKMRESLQTSMPVLVSSVNQPGRSLDGLDGPAIDQWVAKLEEEDEEADRRP